MIHNCNLLAGYWLLLSIATNKQNKTNAIVIRTHTHTYWMPTFEPHDGCCAKNRREKKLIRRVANISPSLLIRHFWTSPHLCVSRTSPFPCFARPTDEMKLQLSFSTRNYIAWKRYVAAIASISMLKTKSHLSSSSSQYKIPDVWHLKLRFQVGSNIMCVVYTVYCVLRRTTSYINSCTVV